MTRWPTLLTIAAVLGMALLAACGGDDDDSSDQGMVTLTPLTPAADLQQIAQVAEVRAESYSGLDAAATVDGDHVVVTYSGIPDDVAQAVFGRRGVLDFRRVLTDVQGYVRCEAADGTEFVVPPTLVNPDPVSGQRARCFTQDTVGNPVWETAVVAGPGGQPLSISNDSVEPGSWLVVEEPSPGLTASFTAEGTDVLTEITRPLTGYPLGIFLDAELIGAPVIQQPITNGEPIISGFNIDEARVYAAVLDGGPLPVDIQVTPADQ